MIEKPTVDDADDDATDDVDGASVSIHDDFNESHACK